jgi:hypothetical protein
MRVIVVTSWLTPDGVWMHKRYDRFGAVNVIWVTWLIGRPVAARHYRGGGGPGAFFGGMMGGLFRR